MLHRFQKTNRQETAKIDMAPMIDCIFILLIFFIVTSVFVDDPGIEVQKPDVSGAEVMDRNALLIAISDENRIFFDGQEIRMDQVAAFVKQAAFDLDSPLIIRADRSASHGVFAGVYAEAKRAGVAHVQFSTEQADSP